MNGDLISREATVNALKERYCDGCTYYGVRCKSVLAENCPIYNAIIAVDAVPAVDAEPVQHGKWEKIRDSQMYDDYYCVYFDYECSNCGDVTNDRHKLPDYCPTCGAKMDADECTQIES